MQQTSVLHPEGILEAVQVKGATFSTTFVLESLKCCCSRRKQVGHNSRPLLCVGSWEVLQLDFLVALPFQTSRRTCEPEGAARRCGVLQLSGGQSGRGAKSAQQNAHPFQGHGWVVCGPKDLQRLPTQVMSQQKMTEREQKSVEHLFYQWKHCLGLKQHIVIFRYSREESFTTLNVDIRNHQNLLESLEQYVKGDLLEGANAYHCEKCNKKVINTASFHPTVLWDVLIEAKANATEIGYFSGWHSEANVYQETTSNAGHTTEEVRLRLGTRMCNQVQRLLRISERIRHGTVHGARSGENRR